MATIQDIETQMQRVAQVRQQAIDEEKARLARETANQRTVREAEMELLNLQKQHAETQFADVLAASDTKVSEQNTLLGMKLFPALDHVESTLQTALPMVEQVKDLFTQQQGIHDEALAVLNNLFAAMPPVAASANNDSSLETVLRNGRVLVEYENKITPALPISYALLDWIHRAQDDTQRRIRCGIAYALTGHLFEIDPRLPPADRTKLREEVKQKTRRHQGRLHFS